MPKQSTSNKSNKVSTRKRSMYNGLKKLKNYTKNKRVVLI